jgi:hypothetical protein
MPSPTASVPALKARSAATSSYVGRFDEPDAKLIAVDPSKLATSVCFPHCRKHKEKLLQGKTFDRTANGKSSPGLRYILHCTRTLPRTVDRHHVRGEPALEYDTMCLTLFHLSNRRTKMNDDGTANNATDYHIAILARCDFSRPRCTKNIGGRLIFAQSDGALQLVPVCRRTQGSANFYAS